MVAEKVIDIIEKRRQAAEKNMELFRDNCTAISTYKSLIAEHNKLCMLAVLCKAPLTMNPEKIKRHFDIVRDYLTEIAQTSEMASQISADADCFINEFKPERVDSYDKEVGAFIRSHVDLSLAANLAKRGKK